MLQQLDLGIKPVIKHTFENYIVSPSNQQVVSHLNYLINYPSAHYLYLWGEPGVGKSHLLHAVCEAASVKNLVANYITFKNNELINSNIFEAMIEDSESLNSFDIICLDDIDLLISDRKAEEQLFAFYNIIKDANNKTLIISGNKSVQHLPCCIADLKSRLASGASYCVKPLTDSEKQNLLQTRAHERGMTLSDDLAKYLIQRGRRDINSLFEMLDKLDTASLQHKRKLSIPFAREVLFN